MMYLTDEQSIQINALARDLEMRTGVEFIAAVVGKCDTYPEIPWKAFALGAALGALAAVVYHLMLPDWTPGWLLLPTLCWVLGAGALAAVLTPFWPAWARFFLDAQRAEMESRQYAQGVFLENELYGTRQRKAILLLIGLFERRVVLLPDSGVRERLEVDQWDAVIHEMVPHLRRGHHFQALRDGIAGIEKTLLAAGFKGSPDATDQVPDELIQQRGAVS